MTARPSFRSVAARAGWRGISGSPRLPRTERRGLRRTRCRASLFAEAG